MGCARLLLEERRKLFRLCSLAELAVYVMVPYGCQLVTLYYIVLGNNIGGSDSMANTSEMKKTAQCFLIQQPVHLGSYDC